MSLRRTLLATPCLAALLVLTSGPLAAAEQAPTPWAQFLAQMTSEGWTPISAGVFERRLGPSKVEHLGYGREGLAWTIDDLTRQLQRMRGEYRRFPTRELADAITELELTLGRAASELRNLPSDLTIQGSALAGGSCSQICYSATADAYPLSSGGVGAIANAQFNSTCGYVGDTYAYAYARATAGTTTTTIAQSDPKTGTSISSNASASVAGGSVSGIPCYSEASSYAQSSTLGIAYSTSDTNSSCPAPPPNPTVSINGSSYFYFDARYCYTATWTAAVSGGVSPYTYQWLFNGTVVGSGSTYSRSVCWNTGSFTLDLAVTSTGGGTGNASLFATVEYDPAPVCAALPCY